MGHVRDLPKKDIGVDLENNFTPHYEIDATKKSLITELRGLPKNQILYIWLLITTEKVRLSLGIL